jgi:sugar/nucleoside kinase (ribokinase family)
MTHYDAAKAMFLAANAAAICVTREGAAYSIPSFAEVLKFIVDGDEDI